MIDPSELVLNKDGSIYHLKLQPEQLAKNIIVAGDPGRIKKISQHFDRIDHIVENREFVSHTGVYKNKAVTALATGIGTDNIDIVLNELDALVNVDLKNRTILEEKTSLNIVRIGTCGSIQEHVPADTIVASSAALGLEGLMHFYDFHMDNEEQSICNEIIKQVKWETAINQPYLVKGSTTLLDKVAKDYIQGITLTAPGFYAPQGRQIRLKPRFPDYNERLRSFSYREHKIINYEMETSALYGLSKLLGHQACTVCAVVANRYANSFSSNYQVTINQLIEEVLESLLT